MKRTLCFSLSFLLLTNLAMSAYAASDRLVITQKDIMEHQASVAPQGAAQNQVFAFPYADINQNVRLSYTIGSTLPPATTFPVRIDRQPTTKIVLGGEEPSSEQQRITAGSLADHFQWGTHRIIFGLPGDPHVVGFSVPFIAGETVSLIPASDATYVVITLTVEGYTPYTPTPKRIYNVSIPEVGTTLPATASWAQLPAPVGMTLVMTLNEYQGIFTDPHNPNAERTLVIEDPTLPAPMVFGPYVYPRVPPGENRKG